MQVPDLARSVADALQPPALAPTAVLQGAQSAPQLAQPELQKSVSNKAESSHHTALVNELDHHELQQVAALLAKAAAAKKAQHIASAPPPPPLNGPLFATF